MANSITVDDYYKFRFLKSIDVSPSGRYIAYTLVTYEERTIDVINEKPQQHKMKEVTNIWILDNQNSLQKQLTYGKSDLYPSFSWDEKFLCFTSKREKKSQLYLIPLDGGEASALTSLTQGVESKGIWSPIGGHIAFSTRKLTKDPDEKEPYWFSRDFYRLDAAGNVDHFIHDIYTVEINTKEVNQLTENEYHNTYPQWSPDGSKIAYHASFAPNKIDALFSSINLWDLETKSTRELTQNIRCDSLINPLWLNDAEIAFIGVDNSVRIGTKSELYICNIETNEISCRTRNYKYSLGSGLQADMPTAEARMRRICFDGNYVYTNVQQEGKMVICQISISEEEIVQNLIDGLCANFIQSVNDGTIIYCSSNPNNPLDLYSFEISKEKETLITRLNEEFLTTKLMPSVEHINFKGNDGVDVEGWFLRPTNQSTNLPTLLNIHGGPHYGWGWIFQFEVQYLVGLGYGVLMVNHRGSTGYGDDFSTKILGDWGNHDFNDLMAGIDYVINAGWADKNKLGCFGISGGGNLSSWIVGNTNRFKAAIPENPVTNWRSFYGTSDIGRWFAKEELGGLPHEIPEIYDKCSPISYAHQATTPTLMIQHDNDLRCPAEQSEQFYAVLRDVGCIVEMLRMPGTSHGGSGIGPLKIRETQNKEIINWFDKFVMKGDIK